jgi:hypothetical protein
MNDLQTVERYLRFLRDLKETVDFNPNTSVSTIIARHRVSKRCTQALQDGGILRKEGDKRISKWFWVSPVLPNIKMADELVTRQQKIQIDYNVKNRAKKKEIRRHTNKVKLDAQEAQQPKHVKTPTKVLDVRNVEAEEVKQKSINDVVYELASANVGAVHQVQYQEIVQPSFPRRATTEKVNRRVKEVEVKPEREKLFSVLWGVIKVKW